MGLSYALASVSAFMLLELFTLTGYDTRSLVALLGLMGLPLVFDLLGRSSAMLVDMTYEPLEVAAFAIGVLFVFPKRFQAVRLAGDIEDPVVIIGESGVVRDTNEAAVDLFPALQGTVGDRLVERVPVLAGDLAEGDDEVLELERDGETRYYHVSTNPFTVGSTRIGRMVLVNDVTREERYRRQIEEQNERLGQLAGVISHDLRNPLNVASGRLEMARKQRDDENLEAVAASLDRMQRLIENLLTMTREGLDVGEKRPVSLATLAEGAWSTVATAGADLVVEDDPVLLADPDRLRQALENLFRNAVEHGSTSSRTASGDSVEHGSTGSRPEADDSVEHGGDQVTVTVGPLDDGTGFFVADDGPGIPRRSATGCWRSARAAATAAASAWPSSTPSARPTAGRSPSPRRPTVAPGSSSPASSGSSPEGRPTASPPTPTRSGAGSRPAARPTAERRHGESRGCSRLRRRSLAATLITAPPAVPTHAVRTHRAPAGRPGRRPRVRPRTGRATRSRTRPGGRAPDGHPRRGR
jgi:signal transduction histidine kinase